MSGEKPSSQRRPYPFSNLVILCIWKKKKEGYFTNLSFRNARPCTEVIVCTAYCIALCSPYERSQFGTCRWGAGVGAEQNRVTAGLYEKSNFSDNFTVLRFSVNRTPVNGFGDDGCRVRWRRRRLPVRERKQGLYYYVYCVSRTTIFFFSATKCPHAEKRKVNFIPPSIVVKHHDGKGKKKKKKKEVRQLINPITPHVTDGISSEYDRSSCGFRALPIPRAKLLTFVVWVTELKSNLLCPRDNDHWKILFNLVFRAKYSV